MYEALRNSETHVPRPSIQIRHDARSANLGRRFSIILAIKDNKFEVVAPRTKDICGFTLKKSTITGSTDCELGIQSITNDCSLFKPVDGRPPIEILPVGTPVKYTEDHKAIALGTNAAHYL
uniref:Uncharacterized protein n=1 Tax=Schistocephalus solidus TaxID=70667 RepID=A0A0X3Q3H9_SCHSO